MESKTAISQMIKEFESLRDLTPTLRDRLYLEATLAVVSKHLFIEKQQIIDAHIAGQKFASDNHNPDSEEYYNKTYKN